jgi:lipopolysaccharide export LptBFGC system permease protein LptF
MENFFYNDKFYRDIEELSEDLDDIQEENDIKELPEDYKIVVYKSSLEQLVYFDVDWFFDNIDEDRYSEQRSDEEATQIQKALIDSIDFDKLNKQIPQLHYPTREEAFITKEDLLKYYQE